MATVPENEERDLGWRRQLRRAMLIAAVLLLALLLYLRPRPANPPAPEPSLGITWGTSSMSSGSLRTSFAQPRNDPDLGLPPGMTEEPTNLAYRFCVVGAGRRGYPNPNLRPDEVAGYLQSNHRSAGSLLSAFRAESNDWSQHEEAHSLLEEAKTNFPADPRVDFEAASTSQNPEERRHWLDALKSSAPDNALGDYLSAKEHLQSGDYESAFAELSAAAGKPLQDYSLEFIQSAYEMYRAAGRSEVEAKALAMYELPIPASDYQLLAYNLVDLANTYRQSGDNASAQTALQVALDLGQRLDDTGSPGWAQKRGLFIQKTALAAMDPDAPFGTTGEMVRDRSAAVDQGLQALEKSYKQFGLISYFLSDEDFGRFLDLQLRLGYRVAYQWVSSKYSPPPPP